MIGLDDVFPASVNFSFSLLVFPLSTLLYTDILSIFLFFDIFHLMFLIFMHSVIDLWDLLIILIMWRKVGFSLCLFFYLVYYLKT